MRLLLILVFLLSALAAGDAKKVVFDLVTGDIRKFEHVVLNSVAAHTAHYAEEGKRFKAVFVIHGDAYRFFFKSLEGTPYASAPVAARRAEFEQRLRELLKKYDVTFEVCSTGMRMRKLPFENLYDFVTPIYSATSGLIAWQEKGYAYIMVP